MKLACRNIRLQYPNSETDVLRDLTFEVEEPGFHALFGPSGVGKTSLARILSGDIKTFSGELITHGASPLFYTYNTERLPDWSSAMRHLEKITPPDRKPLKDELVEIFGLSDVIDSRFSQLSLGQKNRVNLIRYLVQDFKALIMDESLANVDEQTREKIILTIKEIFPNRCFFYISHNVSEVSKVCRRILVIRGLHRTPQVVWVAGNDQMPGRPPERDALEKTMLEVMNAA